MCNFTSNRVQEEGLEGKKGGTIGHCCVSQNTWVFEFPSSGANLGSCFSRVGQPIQGLLDTQSPALDTLPSR